MKESNVTISVIIPVYNRENTIKRCIDSVLYSGYEDIQIIVIDDGSTDGSWDIIKGYTDSRVIAKHVENGGVCSARNKGIKIASGDYIHFVDSDDFVEPGIYNKCSECIHNNAPDMILFDYYVYFDQNHSCYKAESPDIPKNTLLDREYIRNNILPVMVNIDNRKELFIQSYSCIKLYKSSIIKDNHVRFDETRPRWEDRIFQVYFLKYASSFYYLPQEGYYYVMGHSSFSHSYDRRIYDMVLNGSEDYETIVGDLYNFEIPYTYTYYCKLFINTVLQQFELNVERETLYNDIEKAILSKKAFDLFEKFTPMTRFETNIRQAVLAKEASAAFEQFEEEYLNRKAEKEKQERKQKSILRRGRNKMSRILRRIIK